MQFSECEYQVEQHVAYVTLNRPDKGNALNERMIAELTEVMRIVSNENDIYVLCIRAHGKHFCTGADLVEMQSNSSDPTKLAYLMQLIHDLNVPIVCAVNGAAFGGAIGLIANCDIVIAVESATFCLSEVKLGLVPAIISPFVIEALGIRSAKRLMLTAEKISATQALALGLVHEVVSQESFNESINLCLQNLLTNGPRALRTVKTLCREVVLMNTIQERQKFTTQLLTQIRNSPEAQQRLKNFFEKKNA